MIFKSIHVFLHLYEWFFKIYKRSDQTFVPELDLFFWNIPELDLVSGKRASS